MGGGALASPLSSYPEITIEIMMMENSIIDAQQPIDSKIVRTNAPNRVSE